jgi:hypothetical protein
MVRLVVQKVAALACSKQILRIAVRRRVVEMHRSQRDPAGEGCRVRAVNLRTSTAMIGTTLAGAFATSSSPIKSYVIADRPPVAWIFLSHSSRNVSITISHMHDHREGSDGTATFWSGEDDFLVVPEGVIGPIPRRGVFD